MADLKVFISYQMRPEERVLAWRLQTLGASYGVMVFVPPPNRRALSEEIQIQIKQSDAILAFIMHSPSGIVLQEIRYALSQGRTVIPIVRKGVRIKERGMPKVFEFDPQEPSDLLVKQIFEFLKTQKKKPETSRLIAGLALLGLTLLLMYAFTKD